MTHDLVLSDKKWLESAVASFIAGIRNDTQVSPTPSVGELLSSRLAVLGRLADLERKLMEVRSTTSAGPTLGSVAVIVDGDGRALVGRRGKLDAAHGLWIFPGGKVEAGESAASAAVREAKEETGLSVEVVAPLGFFESFQKGEHRYCAAFLARPVGGVLTPCEEIQELAFRSLDVIERLAPDPDGPMVTRGIVSALRARIPTTNVNDC